MTDTPKTCATCQHSQYETPKFLRCECPARTALTSARIVMLRTDICNDYVRQPIEEGDE